MHNFNRPTEEINKKMYAEDLYISHRELQTAEELEDIDYMPNSSPLPDIPPLAREYILGMGTTRPPEAEYRAEFERRPPAMGMDVRAIEEIVEHSRNPNLLPVQRRRLLSLLRSSMLRSLIPCSGCTTVEQLCDILKAELSSGVPSPVPSWYVYSTTTMGPRRIGYYSCSSRECYKTEHFDTPPYQKCSGCSVPPYCSKECQKLDWKARHKAICKQAKEQRDKTAKVGKMMQMLSDMSMSGQGLGGGASLADMLREAAGNEGVKARRAHLKAEKKR
jgi:hypothetical protein